MKKLLLSILGVTMMAGCSARNPLDITPQPPQANTVTVTVLNGTSIASGAGVFLVGQGIDQAINTNGSGQAVFPVSGTGTFEVGLVGQESRAPVKYVVTVESGKTVYGITLQQSGAAFAVSAPTGQGNGYQFSSVSKSWTIQYLNNSDVAADLDLDLDPSYPVPSGWTASILPGQLRKSEAAALNVVIPQGSDVGTKTLRVRGRTSTGVILLTADIVIVQEWNITIRRVYTYAWNTGSCCTDNYTLSTVSFTAMTSGLPVGAILVFSGGATQWTRDSGCGDAWNATPAGWSNISSPFYSNQINSFITSVNAAGQGPWCSSYGTCFHPTVAFSVSYLTFSKSYSDIFPQYCHSSGFGSTVTNQITVQN